MNVKRLALAATASTMIILIMVAGACKSTTATATTPTPGRPGGGAVVNSDSIVTAKIQSITKQSTGYPWKLDVLIQNTVNVGSLPNPVSNSVGKVVTVLIDQDMTSYKVNDVVTAKIKYSGDVNTPSSIILYMYNVALEVKP